MRFATLIAIGLLLIAAPSADAAIHIVNQSGFTFSPANLTVAVGDTVRWVWGDGLHTVTNGTGAADPNVGTLFDAPLDSGNRSFQFAFTTPGIYPYFCRFHEALGMDGVITVDDTTPVQPATWGRLKTIFEQAGR